MAGQRSPRPPGQHFLADGNIISAIVGAAGISQADVVLDLGAGDGALTAALSGVAGGVVAVELDGHLVRALVERFRGVPAVVVLEGDACTLALPRSPYRVVANIPFASTAAILRRLVEPTGGLTRADVVVQWQVARARSQGGDLLAALWDPWWTFRRGRRIPAAAFRPRPGVDAAVLIVERRPHPRLCPCQAAAFDAFVRDRYRSEPAGGWPARFLRSALGARSAAACRCRASSRTP